VVVFIVHKQESNIARGPVPDEIPQNLKANKKEKKK
jgi:hypothetical protein